ncbi:MAG: BREX protein BrxB domain-containing protein [Ferruginibacter sp.]
MTIAELYEKLADKSFQDPGTGNLFWPTYMYLYKPENEYAIRKEIETIKTRLKRPDNYVDVLMINIFEELIEYLKLQHFGESNMLEELLQIESEEPETVNSLLSTKAGEERFFEWLNSRVTNHLELPNPNNEKKSYVFITGFGQIFPYLRASKFISNFEKYTTGKFKVVVFYPGRVDDTCHLFDKLNDENPYRAIKLINNPYEDSRNI